MKRGRLPSCLLFHGVWRDWHPAVCPWVGERGKADFARESRRMRVQMEQSALLTSASAAPTGDWLSARLSMR
jgi:hypothetical protein